MKYEIKFTTQFKKDLKLAKKQNRNLDELFTVISDLANDISLDQKYRDHFLYGNYNSYRECHITPDWILIYKKEPGVLALILYRIGSHSDLF